MIPIGCLKRSISTSMRMRVHLSRIPHAQPPVGHTRGSRITGWGFGAPLRLHKRRVGKIAGVGKGILWEVRLGYGLGKYLK
jgi:hypothetical protein